ncbi:MAG: 50S ribosomal protein L4 [Chlamydiota bacterium]
MPLKKYNLKGEQTGSVEVQESLLGRLANPQMIKDYIIAIRKNLRQWSANTKDRSEVRATKKKPHAQKGSGRARQGSFVAPHYKGGGVVFGPRPKFDQHVRINRKERRAAIRSLLVEKIGQEGVKVLEPSLLEEAKTKPIASFLDALHLGGKRIIFIGASDQRDSELWIKSTRNLPKVEFLRIQNLNGYALSIATEIVILDRAVDEILHLLGKNHEE